VFYPGETVRLLRELPEAALARYAEGAVVSVVRNEEGVFQAAEVKFYKDLNPVTVTVSPSDLELVISRATLDRTAVFWGLEGPVEKTVEAAVHSILDAGFLLREGLNAVRLYYDREDRWWKWGERFTDPTGAQVVTSAATWDGFIVAFSGWQRYHLEFRLRGRGEATMMLHEREAIYLEQACTTHAAMSLARLLMSLAEAAEGRYCAFPVGSPWLLDEDWKSLLRTPLHPDFFLLPEGGMPQGFPESFRTVKLTGKRALLTSLPIKSEPSEPGIERTERELKLNRLRQCQSLGEKYYDQMYETRLGVTGLYANAKDYFRDAIGLAEELGLKEESEALSKRLGHIKAVFRSQFS
jgi:hypothetical protein